MVLQWGQASRASKLSGRSAGEMVRSRALSRPGSRTGNEEESRSGTGVMIVPHRRLKSFTVCFSNREFNAAFHVARLFAFTRSTMDLCRIGLVSSSSSNSSPDSNSTLPASATTPELTSTSTTSPTTPRPSLAYRPIVSLPASSSSSCSSPSLPRSMPHLVSIPTLSIELPLSLPPVPCLPPAPCFCFLVFSSSSSTRSSTLRQLVLRSRPDGPLNLPHSPLGATTTSLHLH
ncbi:hypothetical protein Mapa_012702 [Marchantia paleacea]|nr:hypothetical protein Mapa_012702 [Marchantia paleacea]